MAERRTSRGRPVMTPEHRRVREWRSRYSRLLAGKGWSHIHNYSHRCVLGGVEINARQFVSLIEALTNFLTQVDDMLTADRLEAKEAKEADRET